MVESNLAFEYVSNDALYKTLVVFLYQYIIERVIRYILQKRLETPALVQIVSINPYSSVDDHFPFILCRS
jgi:hypothetical protein